MPPSPRITLQIDKDKYAALCADMGLSEAYPVKITDRPPPGVRIPQGHALFGVWHRLTKTVTIVTGQREYEFNRLRAVNAELAVTLLHELRHAWQDEQPSGWGSIVRREQDAEAYAQANYHKWRGVIQLRRQTFHRKLPG